MSPRDHPDRELRGVLIAFTVFEYRGTVLGHRTRNLDIDHLPRRIAHFPILDADGDSALVELNGHDFIRIIHWLKGAILVTLLPARLTFALAVSARLFAVRV